MSKFPGGMVETVKVYVLDGEVCYECEYSVKSYIMMIINTLYLKDIKTDLMPPCTMRLTVIEVVQYPKFLATDHYIQNHSVYFK